MHHWKAELEGTRRAIRKKQDVAYHKREVYETDWNRNPTPY